MSAPQGFDVALWTHCLSSTIERFPGAWARLGDLETSMLRDEFEGVKIAKPVFICGLARSGSTALLERLASQPDVGTHRYEDFPPVFTPLLWSRLLARMGKRDLRPIERSHADGIEVTPQSPEAMEEPIWMAFFDALHDPERYAALGEETENAEFERFYREHIAKILTLRGARRYVSKGNYNLSRIGYLLKLFTDARFVIPVRSPEWHVASLMKQHALFCRGEAGNPRATAHLRRVGHFEFGLNRRAVKYEESDAPNVVQGLWRDGYELEGWARYWAQSYAFVANQLEQDARLDAASLVVRYEDLCREPELTLTRIFEHCGLSADRVLIEQGASQLRFPSYYRPTFSDDELAILHRETATVAARFGYAGA